MTTTFLNISNMSDCDIEVVITLLHEAGYKVITIKEGEVRFICDHLSQHHLKNLKENLLQKGYELTSIYQTAWSKRSDGIDML